MTIILYTIYAVIFIIVIISFFDIKLSVSLFIASLILIPFWKVNLGGISIDYNYLYVVFFLVFIFIHRKKLKKKLDTKIISPFIFLYSFLFVLTIFPQSLPIGYKYSYIIGMFLKATVLPLIIWNVSLSEPSFIKYIKVTLVISLVISCIYGILLMRLYGFNPYTSYLSYIFDMKDSALMYSLKVESRFSFSTAGKIQATMSHPMTWTIMLSMVFIVFWALFKREKRKLYIILLLLIGFNILISGVRTGIATIILCGVYFAWRNVNIKTFVGTILAVLCLYLVINANEDLSRIFVSFVDVKGQHSTSKDGSSIQTRLGQLEGVFEELEGFEYLVGKGFGWTSYYQSQYGDHPTIKAFESLVFVILCNSGLLGAFIWLIFFLMLHRQNIVYLKKKEDRIFMDMLVISYVAYSTGTGEYSYMQYFVVLYTFLLVKFKMDQRSQNILQ